VEGDAPVESVEPAQGITEVHIHPTLHRWSPKAALVDGGLRCTDKAQASVAIWINEQGLVQSSYSGSNANLLWAIETMKIGLLRG
jgi:hypothetical protein